MGLCVEMIRAMDRETTRGHCLCDPTLGEECRNCNGDAALEREDRRRA